MLSCLPLACSVRIWSLEFRSTLTSRTRQAARSSTQQRSPFPPGRYKQIRDEMLCVDLAPRNSTLRCNGDSNSGNGFRSRQERIISISTSPTTPILEAHQLPWFSSCRAIDNDPRKLLGEVGRAEVSIRCIRLADPDPHDWPSRSNSEKREVRPPVR